ncbi:Type II inositol 1,4,5-trisphosphate 5-phosphatase, partial [Physocladia obscura]
MSPRTGALLPGDVMKLNITVLVRDTALCRRLNFGQETLDDMFVLHTDLSGKDTFITASGVWQPTAFGSSLELLCSLNKPIRFSGGVEGVKLVAGYLESGKGRELIDASTVLVGSDVKEMIINPERNSSIPNELWRLVDFIYRYGMDVDNLFKISGDATLVQYIVECLDTGAEFDIEALLLDYEQEPEQSNPDSASQEELHKVSESETLEATINNGIIVLDIDLLLKTSKNNVPTKGKILKLFRRKGRVASVHAFADCLLKFLDALAVSIMVPSLYLSCIQEGYVDIAVSQNIIAALPP